MSRFHTPILPATIARLSLANQESGFGPNGNGRCGDLLLDGELVCTYEDKYGHDDVKVFFPDTLDANAREYRIAHVMAALESHNVCGLYEGERTCPSSVITFVVNLLENATEWQRMSDNELPRGIYVATTFRGGLLTVRGSEFKHLLTAIAEMQGGVTALQEAYDKLASTLDADEAFLNTEASLQGLGICTQPKE
jgi:hypothetical protein